MYRGGRGERTSTSALPPRANSEQAVQGSRRVRQASSSSTLNGGPSARVRRTASAALSDDPRNGESVQRRRNVVLPALDARYQRSADVSRMISGDSPRSSGGAAKATKAAPAASSKTPIATPYSAAAPSSRVRRIDPAVDAKVKSAPPSTRDKRPPRAPDAAGRGRRSRVPAEADDGRAAAAETGGERQREERRREERRMQRPLRHPNEYRTRDDKPRRKRSSERLSPVASARPSAASVYAADGVFPALEKAPTAGAIAHRRRPGRRSRDTQPFNMTGVLPGGSTTHEHAYADPNDMTTNAETASAIRSIASSLTSADDVQAPAAKKRPGLLRSNSSSVSLGSQKTSASCSAATSDEEGVLYTSDIEPGSRTFRRNVRCVRDVGVAEDANTRWRPTMEDAYVEKDALGRNGDHSFYGIYDGHGGREAADFLAAHLHRYVELEVKDATSSADVQKGIEQAYLRADRAMIQQGRVGDSGSTAVTAYLRFSAPRKCRLFVANVGDARAVLCRQTPYATKAMRLSYDHKASDSREAARVRAAGGFVQANRVNGVLQIARAFGDRSLKRWVPAEPDQQVVELTPDDKFLILACDGLWDVVSDQDAVTLVQNLNSAEDMARRLVRTAIERNSTDNVTVMVVCF